MNKRLALWVTVGYVIGLVVGIALFHTPGLSKAYLEKYGAEHARYLAITKSPEFQRFEEQPKLHPLPPALEEEERFIEEYRERPEFEAEERRIWWYVEYFKVLNSAAFILYLAALAGKPLVGYLDSQIKAIQTSLDNAAKARQQAAAVKTEAKAKVEEWAAKEAQIKADCDATVARNLERIRAEAADAAAQLARQTEERKQAELYALNRTIKTELVSEAIERLKVQYKTDTSLEKLSANVDRFVNLMERLS